ncbi:hypothetical protein [Pseudarthrobacter phenanthrenivorans]|uniref:Uncharacterized protein n=1 Tax=Pseudarthrobacter phenanthrenivorans TaxID=361575 RepID=A0A0B4D5T2_PSEPS|nr:hypothetical protein [Pseudarthrobacter phenanthrenivorans]KIC68709.1 hypothetical protein RM50_04410 [Pseudarthrobacter phenanthrenivorans]
MKNVIQLRTKRSGAAPCTYHELMHRIAEEGGQVIEMFPSDKALAPDSTQADLMIRPAQEGGALGIALADLPAGVFVDKIRA